MTITAPGGAWKSPISSASVVAESLGFGGIVLEGSWIYWLESRPAEGGRRVIVRRGLDGQTEDLTPQPYNVRTRVHEYGGGDFTVSDGEIYFANYADQRLYRQVPGDEPQPITPADPPDGGRRYADLTVDRARQRIICVHEAHPAGGSEPVNCLAELPMSGNGPDSPPRILASGSDFYAAPRLSPDGSRLAWLSWSHPNMPWDGVELWVAELGESGNPEQAWLIAGGPTESICQPEWSPDGQLYFVSDRSGWWNLYRSDLDGRIERVTEPLEMEFGRPHWVFGAAAYGFASARQLICAASQKGKWSLYSLDPDSRQLARLEIPYSEMGRSDLKVAAGQVVFSAGAPTEPLTILRLDLTANRLEPIRKSVPAAVDSGYLSEPLAIEFPTTDGLTAHAFYYPPANRDYALPPEEKPPLLVKSHGGPTGAASAVLNPAIQYWTSRGFAVLDVNYGGSVGYGREYRERLKGRWGVVDVDDCVNGARYLVRQGLADGGRLAIDGGSAGGYTTLVALTFHDLFRAGASHYGISDLEALARDTHKFESRYLDGLVGPYPARQDLYRERSPINFTERLSCPLILFQGLEDAIVPPSQAELMFRAVRDKGLPCAYIPFAGEQHGFRRAENIRRALDGELYFYSRVFGFDLADPVEPIPIENL